ncbi:MAG: hypothetical protein IPH31_24720 [Lewinellaceae bacterium]|nr:hypothetical protein [Lewinellaceae bacterium]
MDWYSTVLDAFHCNDSFQIETIRNHGIGAQAEYFDAIAGEVDGRAWKWEEE